MNVYSKFVRTTLSKMNPTWFHEFRGVFTLRSFKSRVSCGELITETVTGLIVVYSECNDS